MKKNRRQWWLDAFLLMLFIATFFLDLTGVVLHQWFGIIEGAIILAHVVTHWTWIVTVGSNLAMDAPRRAKFYWFINATLFFGFAAIIFTGVMMSTCLNLALPNYDTWYQIHL